MFYLLSFFFFFSSRRRHTRYIGDWVQTCALPILIDEASENKNVILFIDELHNLIGAGSAIGAPLDAANMLKPALTSGHIRVIGATTEHEYGRSEERV